MIFNIHGLVYIGLYLIVAFIVTLYVHSLYEKNFPKDAENTPTAITIGIFWPLTITLFIIMFVKAYGKHNKK